MFTLLRDEQAARQALFDYFGYVENWRVLPFDDGTSFFWKLDELNGTVRYARQAVELDDERGTGDYYENDIYTQRHLPRWVYRGPDYTMIVVDTHTDSNQFLQIFDNAKEIS